MMMERLGATLIDAGTTPGEISLGRILETGVFILNMEAGEGNKVRGALSMPVASK